MKTFHAPSLLMLWFAFLTGDPKATHAPAATRPEANTRIATTHPNSGTRSQTEEDPVDTFKIEYPNDGDVLKLPLKFMYHASVRDAQAFERYYAGMQYCVEIDRSWTKCEPLLGPKIRRRELTEGNHSALMYIRDAEGVARYHETQPITFTLVSADAFTEHCAARVEQYRQDHHLPKDESILQWAERHGRQQIAAEVRPSLGDEVIPLGPPGPTSPTKADDLLLVIGVKSAVLTNFPRRQAIRETWASKAFLPDNVKVLFLGCSPNMAGIPNAHDRSRFEQAVAFERAVFRDLLTEELECEDAYGLLANKVKAFYHLVVAEYPNAKFVMIADDDIYLHVSRLSTFLYENVNTGQRLYVGEAWSAVLKKKIRPVRYPSSPHYLPKESYPLNEFPPYGTGAITVLSMASVRFISRNGWRLRSLGGIDDVTTAFWLLGTQVHHQHTLAFSSLSIRECANSSTSIAGLSALGIRLFHANLVQGRNLCHEMDDFLCQWRSPASISVNLTLETMETPEESPRLQFELHLRNSTTSTDHQATIVASTLTQAGFQMPWLSRLEEWKTFSSRLCTQVKRYYGEEIISLSSCLMESTKWYEQKQLQLSTRTQC